jgi:hypothetical protein
MSQRRSRRCSIFRSILIFQRFLSSNCKTQFSRPCTCFPPCIRRPIPKQYLLFAVALWHGTQLYAVHDQGSKTGRTVTAVCCNRRRSKRVTASCVVNLLITCSLCLFVSKWKMLWFYFVGWGVVCFISFQVPLTSCASPWRAGGKKNDVRSKSNRLLTLSLLMSYIYIYIYIYIERERERERERELLVRPEI